MPQHSHQQAVAALGAEVDRNSRCNSTEAVVAEQTQELELVPDIVLAAVAGIAVVAESAIVPGSPERWQPEHRTHMDQPLAAGLGIVVELELTDKRQVVQYYRKEQVVLQDKPH